MNTKSPPFAIVSIADAGKTVPEFGRALDLHARGRLDEAAAAFLALADFPHLTVFCQHQLAIIAAQRNDVVQAEDRLRLAVALAPDQPMLLQTLAAVLEGAGKLPVALDVMLDLSRVYYELPDLPRAADTCRRMLAVDGLRYGARANLGTTLCKMGDVRAGIPYLFQAVVLAGRIIPALAAFADQFQSRLVPQGIDLVGERPLPPGTPTGAIDKLADVLTSLGKTMTDLGFPREAVPCHRMSVEIRPAYQLGHWNLALSLLALGEFEEGWTEYEWRWQREPTHDARRLLPIPRWRGQAPEGQRLMVYAEQGYGDSIQFSPLVRRLAQRAAHVVFQAHKPLVRLFEHNFAGTNIQVMCMPNNPDELGTDLPLDGFVAQLSLPHFLGLDYSVLPLQAPLLRAIPEDVLRWASRIGQPRQRRLGVVWAGRPEFSNDINRSMPKDALAALLTLPGIDWVSLQVGPRQREFVEMAPYAVDLGSELQDFADTAAVIAQLDGVVAVDTAVAHLAASMGKPVWLMLPFAPDWRWEDAVERTPWYPSIRVFRQVRAGDWAEVISRIEAAIRRTAPPTGTIADAASIPSPNDQAHPEFEQCSKHFSARREEAMP